jgi:hypothetical protein
MREQAQAEEKLKKQAAYHQQAQGFGGNSALAGSVVGLVGCAAPPPSLRQIAASNAETLKMLELKLRDIRGCSFPSPNGEAKSCPPDECGLPSIESSLVETEYTIARLHALADELLARF